MWNLTTFQPGEIIDIAVQIEEQGSDFYQKLAQRAETDKTREVLLNLAAEEKKHIADFVEFGKDLEAPNPRESYPGEYFDYLKSTVETHLFHDLERLTQSLNTINSEDDVLRLAVTFEKDSILFFFGFRMFVEEKKQAVIDRLIEEEKEHLSRLNAVKKQLEVKKVNKWKCGACGYQLEAENPPEVCPSCKQKCQFIDNNCYTPDCGCSSC